MRGSLIPILAETGEVKDCSNQSGEATEAV